MAEQKETQDHDGQLLTVAGDLRPCLPIPNMRGRVYSESETGMEENPCGKILIVSLIASPDSVSSYDLRNLSQNALHPFGDPSVKRQVAF